MSRKRVKLTAKLIHELAQEAHMMGRLYTMGGEKLNPADQFQRIRALVRGSLKAGSLRYDALIAFDRRLRKEAK